VRHKIVSWNLYYFQQNLLQIMGNGYFLSLPISESGLRGAVFAIVAGEGASAPGPLRLRISKAAFSASHNRLFDRLMKAL
jgi:hypothetical protein